MLSDLHDLWTSMTAAAVLLLVVRVSVFVRAAVTSEKGCGPRPGSFDFVLEL